MKKPKLTFRVKLCLILISTVLLFIGVSQILSYLLLERFYMNKKEAEILAVFSEITSVLSNPGADGQLVSAITDLSQKNNLIIHLSDRDFYNAFSLMPVSARGGAQISGFVSAGSFVNTYMKDIAAKYFPNPGEKPMFAKVGADAVVSVRSRMDRPMMEQRPGLPSDLGFLCMFSPVTLADGSDGYALLQTSLPAISLSVRVTTEFVWIISLIILIIGVPTVIFLARGFSRPISEISDAAKKIAELDFSSKPEPRGHDEISDLAENVKIMSQKLEGTILALTEANEELKKKERLGRELLANVSHELKTPISLIGGYAEGLKLNVAEEDRGYYSGVIIDETAKMSRLVNDILDLSRIEAGFTKMEREAFDISVLLADAARYAPACREKNIALDVRPSGETIVCADEFRVEQAFSNYMANAINHTPSGGVIEVSLSSDNGRVKVSVYNSGALLSGEDRERVWDSFYKADKARTREYGGHGLGLNIVRTIIEAHGGECGADNRENGVVFWFTLAER